MATTKKRTASEPKDQGQRFIDKAKEIGCDESGKPFERAFKKVAPPKKRTKR